MSSTKRVERYYNFIYAWTQITNRFRAFDTPATYAIHRPLMDPESGRFETAVVHRFIADAVRDLRRIVGLDAGCGYGGSTMELARALGGRWHGVTINRHQYRLAVANAAALGIANTSFDLASYDAPLAGLFDVVFGIESLIHSVDPARTIANLAAAVRPGGRFVIIDDMPEPALPARLGGDLHAFKRCWQCPVMPTAAEWSALLEANGCRIVATRDLTDLMRPRTEAEVVVALAEAQHRRRWMRPFGLGLVTDAQIGGLHLERLTRERAVRYMMIVAEKPVGVDARRANDLKGLPELA